MMNGDKLMKQVMAIFSIFMVFFYLGAGTVLIFYTSLSYLDEAVRVIIGSAFIFYGIYRAYRAFVTVKEAFFTKDNDEE
jgi:cytochrome c biogenesis protein CcdA